MAGMRRQALLAAVAAAVMVGVLRVRIAARVTALREDPQHGGALETAVITAVLLGAAIWIGGKVVAAVHNHGNAIQ